MSTTLTIRDLDEPVEKKLRQRAEKNGRTIEAEAREILTREVGSDAERVPTSVCTSVRGIWKGRMSTDELMELTRGD